MVRSGQQHQGGTSTRVKAAQPRTAQPRAAPPRSAQPSAKNARTGQGRTPRQPAAARSVPPEQGPAARAGAAHPPPDWPAAAHPPPDERYRPRARRTSGQPLRAAWDPLAEYGSKGRPARRRRGLVGFVRHYGWRAYAVPVLAVLTALAVLDAHPPAVLSVDSLSNTPPQPAPAPVAPVTTEPTPLVPNPMANEQYNAAMVSAELPPGGPFTERGAGTWSVVPGVSGPFGTGQLFTYTVEIEDGVQLPGGPDGLIRTVDATLNNPKSWIGSGKYAFQRIDSGAPAIRISLASQQTARAICGFKIPFDASCWRGGRAVLNAARWERGAVVFQGNVVAYQQYVVNHEVGHALGFGHRPCVEHGALAPIMMQQTWGVANDYLAAIGTDNVAADGKVCIANPWPYPIQGG